MRGSGGSGIDGEGAGRLNPAEVYEAGMAALLADVLSSASPDSELFARYARNPLAMRPRERAQIEDYLAAVPGARAELAVLRRVAALSPGPSEVS